MMKMDEEFLRKYWEDRKLDEPANEGEIIEFFLDEVSK